MHDTTITEAAFFSSFYNNYNIFMWRFYEIIKDSYRNLSHHYHVNGYVAGQARPGRDSN